MGIVKHEMERLEGLESLANEPLIRAGAVKPCDLHDDVLIRQDDPGAERTAYAIGTKMWQNGEVDGTRPEFMDAIKAALENAADECYQCARVRADD